LAFVALTLPIFLPASATSAVPATDQRVPYHVETWVGYHYGNNEGNSSPASTLRRWSTYVDGDSPYSYQVCNVTGHPCNSVVYVNTSNVYFGTCGWSDGVVNGGLTQQNTLSESAWLHASPAQTYSNRLFNKYSEHCTDASENTGLWINKKSIGGPGNALAWFNAYFQHNWGNAVPDYYMNDDTNIINAFAGHFGSASEYRSWVDLQNAQAAWLARETNKYGAAQKLFFNGCNTNPYVATAVTLVKMRPNIVGCVTEGNVSSVSMRNGRVIYSLDNCARVSLASNGGIFVNGPDEDGGIQARRQATAFNWLCYVRGRVVEWEEEEWGGQYANVFPEEGIYISQPIQSMQMPSGCPDANIPRDGPGNNGTNGNPCAVHGHNDLLVARTNNVYRREFVRCYDRGVAVGRCAVIWNMSDTLVRVGPDWLTQRYAHTMTMSGGTIDGRGTVNLTTPITPAGTAIAPYDALFLFQ
ncbi:MAG: hypothetical protein ACXWNZ_17255, partial [Vulcanimicrobiaceae bacterium]